MLLGGFVRGLAGEGVTWVGGEGRGSMEDLVAEFMEAVRTSGPRSGVTRLESDTMMDQGQGSDSLEGFSMETRQEVDFTDMLWSTLCKAQSYQELTEAFRTVFSTILAEEIRPFVYARNKTRVVRLVGGLVRGGETLPDKLAAKELSHLVSDTLEQDVLLLSKLHLVVELTALSHTFLSLSPCCTLPWPA